MSTPEGAACPVPLLHHEQIILGHGSGGRLTHELIERLFQPLLASHDADDPLIEADDAAVLPCKQLADGHAALAISTDSHVVNPLFFPGGDIGRLSICGTVNDVAMVGAHPLWITVGFILEEGLRTCDLERIVRSMHEAAVEAGVRIVAGDTKVAERGKVDGVYITTTGVGSILAGRNTRAANIQPGDQVLVSGTLGDHGIAVLAARGDLAFETTVASDTAPLNGMVEAMFESGADIHSLRDLTRGGLAAALNELADKSGVAIVLEEAAIPVRPAVAAASEMLGFDPLHIANEGKLVAFVPQQDAAAVLRAMRTHRYGAEAQCIGQVTASPGGRVLMRTSIGGSRIIDTPAGELLPRIC